MEYGEHWYAVCCNTVRRELRSKKDEPYYSTRPGPSNRKSQIFTNYVNHVAQTVVDFPEGTFPGSPQSDDGG
jgi:hypothetical protein